MPTAKKYMGLEHGDPYMENGKMYVDVVTGINHSTGVMYTKRVRWYSDPEWRRMYGEPKVVNYRDILGFSDPGYIVIYYGDTYANLSWFKEKPECRYNKNWGWYTPSTEPVPAEIPTGVKIANLYWKDIATENETIDEAKVAEIVNSILYSDVKSGEYVGEVGDRTIFDLTVKKAIGLDSYYGHSTMHVMEDANGNTFVWTTASRTLEVGTTYTMKGTIKDHSEYKGVKQTILSRCSIIK